MLLPLVAGLTVVTLLGAGAGAGAQPRWRAPSDPLIRAVAAGLVPETHESLQHHVHSHLDVYVDGVHQTVPAGIGIQIDDPGVKNGVVNGSPAYGGIRECAQPCISPLHTHDVSGVLHTESAKNIDNTLGQFFTEWGVPLSAKCVGDYCAPKTKIAVYVGGARDRKSTRLNSSHSS